MWEDEHASARSIKTLITATGALNGVPSKKDSTLCENRVRVFHASMRFSFVCETPNNPQVSITRTMARNKSIPDVSEIGLC